MRDRRASRGGRGFTTRKVDTRPAQKVFLIVCEGAKTEPNYFRGFKVAGDVLDVRGIGDNTLSLVQQAAALKEQGEYDQTWCVFDRDSFPADRFNRALELARHQGMRVAYSNEAFELWYLLHFAYHDAATARADYGDRLSRHLGSRYAKNRDDIFDLLESRQPDAVRNTEQLMAQYPAPDPEADNPSTTVHLLVAELNRYRRP